MSRVEDQDNCHPSYSIKTDDQVDHDKTLVKKCCFRLSQKTWDILRIVRIRLFLTFTISYMVGTFVCVSDEYILLLGLIPVAIIWTETIYICVKNDAKEWYW